MRIRLRRLLAGITKLTKVGTVFAVIFIFIPNADAQFRSVKDIGASIKNEEILLEKLQKDKRSAVRQLESISIQMENYKNLSAALDREMKANKERIDAIRNDMQKLNNYISKTKKDISKSNAFFIDNLGFSEVTVIATAQNPSSTVKTLEILEKAGEKLENNVREQSLKVFEMGRLIAEERARLNEALILNARRKDTLAKLEKENKRYKNTLTLIKNDEAGRKEYVEMLQFQRQELEGELKRASDLVIKRNERMAKREVVTNIPKGTMVWPVQGEVVGVFGETFMEDAGVTFFHKGIKIRPEKSTPVFSAAGGEVIFIDNIRGFDNIIVVDHGEAFYTVYGNIGEVKAEMGAKILRGDILGRINVDLNNNTSYLYFEIRKNDEALNPADWLAGYKRR